jgi:hypothetical protein
MSTGGKEAKCAEDLALILSVNYSPEKQQHRKQFFGGRIKENDGGGKFNYDIL